MRIQPLFKAISTSPIAASAPSAITLLLLQQTPFQPFTVRTNSTLAHLTAPKIANSSPVHAGLLYLRFIATPF
jgi:hypothetical protein